MPGPGLPLLSPLHDPLPPSPHLLAAALLSTTIWWAICLYVNDTVWHDKTRIHVNKHALQLHIFCTPFTTCYGDVLSHACAACKQKCCHCCLFACMYEACFFKHVCLPYFAFIADILTCPLSCLPFPMHAFGWGLVGWFEKVDLSVNCCVNCSPLPCFCLSFLPHMPRSTPPHAPIFFLAVPCHNSSPPLSMPHLSLWHTHARMALPGYPPNSLYILTLMAGICASIPFPLPTAFCAFSTTACLLHCSVMPTASFSVSLSLSPSLMPPF